MAESDAKILIEIQPTVKPVGTPDYDWCGYTRGIKDYPTYHYGHSSAEVLADILVLLLERKR